MSRTNRSCVVPISLALALAMAACSTEKPREAQGPAAPPPAAPAPAAPEPAAQAPAVPEPAGAPPAMSPEEQAMAAAWEKAAKPGEQHAWLATMAGSWQFEGSFWTVPGGEPTRSAGTAERTAISGGRVMREVVSSTFYGQPFEGVGHTGYDNVTGKYWSTWFDDMSTSVMVSTGTCEQGACTFDGTNTDPMTGKAATSRMTSKHEGDREVHEMFGPGPDGKEFKMMELVYTRKK
jgi:hypothetical protein